MIMSAYDQGVFAYFNGIYYKDNPHTPLTKPWNDWNEGWIIGQSYSDDKCSTKDTNMTPYQKALFVCYSIAIFAIIVAMLHFKGVI